MYTKKANMPKKTVTREEFETIIAQQFKGLWTPGYNQEIDSLIDRLFQEFASANFSRKETNQVIFGAKSYLMHQKNEYVNFSRKDNFSRTVELILNREDKKIFQEIERADNKFKDFCRECFGKVEGLTLLTNDFWELAKQNYQLKTSTISKKCKDDAERLVGLYKTFASIFNTIARHTDDYASKDDLLSETRNSLVTIIKNNESSVKKMLEQGDKVAESFDEFLEELTKTDDPRVRFSAQEVRQLLSKTTSVVRIANAKKWKLISGVLNDYIDRISEKYSDDSFKQTYSSKTMILDAGSLLRVNAGDLSVAVELFLGKTFKEALGEEMADLLQKPTTKITNKKLDLLTFLPNFKIKDMDKATNKYIVGTGPSIFVKMNPNNLYDNLNDLATCFCKAYDYYDERFGAKIKFLNEKGIDIQEILTKDNIFDILNINQKMTKEGKENFVENVKIFKNLVSPSDVARIVQHNFNFICKQPKEVMYELKEIAGQANSIEDFKAKIQDYVNQKVRAKISYDRQSFSTVKKERAPRIKKDKIEFQDFNIDPSFLEQLGFVEEVEEKSSTVQKPGKTPAHEMIKKEPHGSLPERFEEAVLYYSTQMENLAGNIKKFNYPSDETNAEEYQKVDIVAKANTKKLIKELSGIVSKMNEAEKEICIENLEGCIELIEDLLDDRVSEKNSLTKFYISSQEQLNSIKKEIKNGSEKTIRKNINEAINNIAINIVPDVMESKEYNQMKKDMYTLLATKYHFPQRKYKIARDKKALELTKAKEEKQLYISKNGFVMLQARALKNALDFLEEWRDGYIKEKESKLIEEEKCKAALFDEKKENRIAELNDEKEQLLQRKDTIEKSIESGELAIGNKRHKLKRATPNKPCRKYASQPWAARLDDQIAGRQDKLVNLQSERETINTRLQEIDEELRQIEGGNSNDAPTNLI